MDPRPVNEVLMDLSLRHATFLERFRSGEAMRMRKFLNGQVLPELQERMRGMSGQLSSLGKQEQLARLAFLEGDLRGYMQQAMVRKRADFEHTMVKLSQLEGRATQRIFQEAVDARLGLNFAIPSEGYLAQLVSTQPIHGRLLKEWFDGYEGTVARNVSQQMRLGLAQGETISQLSGRVRNVSEVSKNQAEAIVRTTATNVSANAREATFKENENVIKGVRYIATLDARTTEICAELDGQVFAIDDGPRPPQHINCRSTTVPVLADWKELGIDLKEAPVGTRSSMNGQVPANMNYQQWLKRQPRAVQNEVLGPTRAELWRQGKVHFTRFTADGRVLNLSELQKLIETGKAQYPKPIKGSLGPAALKKIGAKKMPKAKPIAPPPPPKPRPVAPKPTPPTPPPKPKPKPTPKSKPKPESKPKLPPKGVTRQDFIKDPEAALKRLEEDILRRKGVPVQTNTASKILDPLTRDDLVRMQSDLRNMKAGSIERRMIKERFDRTIANLERRGYKFTPAEKVDLLKGENIPTRRMLRLSERADLEQLQRIRKWLADPEEMAQIVKVNGQGIYDSLYAEIRQIEARLTKAGVSKVDIENVAGTALSEATTGIKTVTVITKEDLFQAIELQTPERLPAFRTTGPLAKSARLTQAEEFLQRMVHRDILRAAQNTHASPLSSGQRAHAYSKLKTIHIAPENGTRTVVHELGHVIESNNPSVIARSKAWIRQRSPGESPRRLSELTGNTFYKSDEFAYKDKFLDSYIGKVYNRDSSEVLSMGLEMLFANPVDLLKRDPDMFKFILEQITR